MQIPLRLAAWLFAACLSCVAAAAELPPFRTLGVSEGMPSSAISQMVQDREGRVWFGTADGLARWDGVEMRVFRHEPEVPDSLPAGPIQVLFIDNQHRLWVGIYDAGLAVMDPGSTAFRSYRRVPSDPKSLQSNDIWSIAQQRDGTLWVGTHRGGLHRLRADGNGFDHFQFDPSRRDSLSHDDVVALFVDAEDRLWAATYGGGLNRFDARTGTFIRFRHSALDPKSLSDDRVVNLYQDAAGTLWVITAGGLNRVRADGGFDRWTDAPFNVALMTMHQDRRGEYWVGAQDALLRFRDPDGPVFEHRHRPALFGSLPDDSVWSILEDREGSLWFGTLGGGAAQLPPTWRNFRVFQHDPMDPDSLTDNHLRGLGQMRDGRVLATTFNSGLNALDLKTGRSERWRAGAETGLTSDRVWSALEDSRGRLWVGHHAGLSVRNPGAPTFSHLQAGAQGLAGAMVDQLIEGDDGEIWAGSFGSGINRIHTDGSVEVFRHDPRVSGSPSGNEVEQIVKAPDGQLWFAGAGGVDRFDARSGKFRQVLASARVNALAFDLKGRLWIHHNGVLERISVDPSGTASVELRVDSGAGLPAFEAGGLVVDRTGRLWLSSRRGLFRVSTGDPIEIEHFDTTDGLPTPELTDRPPLVLDDGSIALASPAGLVVFNPDGLEQNTYVPSLRVLELSLRRKDRREYLDTSDLQVRMTHEDRDLLVSVRSDSLATPAANRYRSRLLGYDDGWVSLPSSGERSFTVLPPGSYTLELQGSNDSGLFSKTLRIGIEVLPSPWLTPRAFVAYGVGVLLMMLLFGLGYRGYMNRRQRMALAHARAAWAEQTSEAKTKFLATMSHEIRTPLTGVLGMTDLLLETGLTEKQAHYARAARQSGRTLLRLVNDVLDLSKIEAGRLELASERVDLRRLIEECVGLFMPLAERKRLALAYNSSSDAPRHVMGDATRLRQILTNLIGNAVKFTDQGGVRVEHESDGEGGFFIHISDSGPGIAREAQARVFEPYTQEGPRTRATGTGLGLAICHELIRVMGGQIRLESEPGRGSRFSIQLRLPAADSPAERTPVMHSDGRKLRVLVVEDDATSRDVMSGLLTTMGHEVEAVGDGLAALGAQSQGDFDLIFMDLDLPLVDGLTTFQLLRGVESNERRRAVPVIAISGRAFAEDRQRCLDAGMLAFLPKPVTRDTLVEAIALLQEMQSAPGEFRKPELSEA